MTNQLASLGPSLCAVVIFHSLYKVKLTDNGSLAFDVVKEFYGTLENVQ